MPQSTSSGPSEPDSRTAGTDTAAPSSPPSRTDSYADPGVRVRLPSDYCTTELPEWRAVLFSIALPFPADALPTELAGQRLIDLAEPWIPGRFPGIQSITLPDAPALDGGRYTTPDRPADGPGSWSRSPRAFHNTACSRFRSPLQESVGAVGVDARTREDQAGDTDVRCFRRVFTADRYEGTDPDDGYAPVSPGQPETPQEKYEITLIPEAPGPAAETAARPSVELLCTEFLQYRGDYAHAVPGDAHEQPPLIELAHDYLVLHVLVQNCPGELLETVSASLNRPRTAVHLRRWGATDAPFTAHPLLTMFVKTAVAELCEGMPGPGATDLPVTVGNGGHLVVPKARRGLSWKHLPQGTDPDTGDAVAVHRGSRRKPVRIVCAVPGRTGYGGPGLMDDLDGSGSWGTADAWAWLLSSGADTYAEGIPRYSTSCDSPAGDRSRYEYWTMHASPAGVALLRNGPASAPDAGVWMLSGTRFLDLALLVHRSSPVLDNLGQRLRKIRFRTQVAGEDLDRALEIFEDIQSDSVHFRDRLWFDTVPGRDIDTVVMLALRDESGVTARYGDIADELALRESVYITQYNAKQLRLDRQKERQSNVQNVLFGILAVAFAVPGIIQVSGMDQNGGTVWFTLAVMAAVACVLLPLLRFATRPRRTPPTRD